MKKFTLVLISILLFSSTLIITYAGAEDNIMDKSYYINIMESQAGFVKKLQLNNGAIGYYKAGINPGNYADLSMPEVDGIKPQTYTSWKSTKIIPYFSSFACLGLINSAEILGDLSVKQIALDYINWYISHMNSADEDINGVADTVYDYFIFQNPQDGQIIEVTLHDAYSSKYANPKENPYDYDSTDSYAAVFLEILYEYTRVFDNNFLNDKKDLVARLIDVILATYIPKLGLTGAKPNYMVCYLMDNCEVFKGFNAAYNIYNEFIDDQAAKSNVSVYAENIKNAILKSFWNNENQAFTAGVFEDGNPAYGTSESELKNFYPQATSQLFPIIFDLIDKDDSTAKMVYNRFKNEYIQKSVVGKDWSVYSTGDSYPWVILLRAVVEMEDYQTANTFINTVRTQFILSGYTSSNFYNAEAGHMLISLSEIMKKHYPEHIGFDDTSEDNSDEESSINSELSQNNSEEQSLPANKPDKTGNTLLYTGIGAALVVAASAIIIILKKNKKNMEK
ncbi:hypothetical protein LJB90_00180 [Eubacteriales bacterium OttesenSCG-928-G02]|nr:hypothetical protein [Eubacteriales bacterium OttesenSCG-928-G02]